MPGNLKYNTGLEKIRHQLAKQVDYWKNSFTIQGETKKEVPPTVNGFFWIIYIQKYKTKEEKNDLMF